MTAPLKLKADTEEDLAIISAILQDAIIPICDLTLQLPDNLFVAVANRFCWERVGEARAGFFNRAKQFERINCGVRFGRVTRARYRGINMMDRAQMLSLLCLEAEPGAILLQFANNAAIRLEVEAIDVQLEDIGLPWPTTSRPNHAKPEDSASAAR